jgi:thioredoxin reductase (NADPH)
MDPVILIAAATPDGVAGLRDEFDRYRRDYRIELVSSHDGAIERLTELAAEAAPVAMVLTGASARAPEGAVESTGMDVLRAAQRLTRTASRVLLLEWGLRAEQMSVVTTELELGSIDMVLTKPTGPRDEEFHAAISELLGEWSWTTAPLVEAVKIVDDGRGRGWELHELLDRLGVPSGLHAPDSPTGREILGAAGAASRLPVVEVMGATILSDPTNRALAVAFGVAVDVTSTVFDLAIVGAGPAGLGAAVYGASEGLSTVVLEGSAFGGQAATSSMIRNYPGFPRGITGRQLGRRAVMQAASLGAGFDLARAVVALEPASPHRLTLDDGDVVEAHAVVLACGVTYRRLGVESVESLLGHGVYYGASTTHARVLDGAEVVVVGAGNSGGQAAVLLARHAARVTLVARGPSLAATMSTYLIDHIASTDVITVRTNTEIVDGGGDGRLEWLSLRDRETGAVDRVAAQGLFVLIGTETRTGWLPPSVQRDDHGFVLTGEAIDASRWPIGRAPYPFETSVPGVFAVGDVRANKVKRVAAAVGEGAVVVPTVHAFLGELRAGGG